MGGEEKGEDQLKAVSFAAGTAAFMACVERAVMVSVFVHWRLWAFLALNLLLLAILFTSKSQIKLNRIKEEDICYEKLEKSKNKNKKRRQECSHLVSVNGGCEIVKVHKATNLLNRETKDGDEDGTRDDYDELSEEELKKRVEEFIARFRQHLVSDAKGTHVTGCTLEREIYASGAFSPLTHLVKDRNSIL